MAEIPITIRGDVDQRAVEQLRRCAQAGDAVAAVLCADGHVGYSQPIGGAVAYPDHISPSGVGYDIACIAAGTPVTTQDGHHLPVESVPVGAPITCWDGRRLRQAMSCLGSVARGPRRVRRVLLRNGTALVLTPDHRVRTPLGWCAAGDLRPGDRLACASFVGLPYQPAPDEVSLRPPSRADELGSRGLWPLRGDDPRLPALLRLFGTLCGDGHLARDGKAVSWWTVVPEDARAIAADVARLGFRPSVYVRTRGQGHRDEHHVRVNSVALHALLAALGCPVGSKVDGWTPEPMPWLWSLPDWMRAQVLSGVASAEATTPSLRGRSPASLAIKQAGTSRHAIAWVEGLLSSLGFAVGTSLSGPARGSRQTWVTQIVGGSDEYLRFLREVGFCHALEKRVAAAQVASVCWSAGVERARRSAAVAEAQRLRAAGGSTVREVVAAVSTSYAVPPSLIHHGLYGRGRPRAGAAGGPGADTSGEIAWVPVALVEDGGVASVYDVVTGDVAAAFQANGVCVHNCGNKAVRTDLPVEDVRGDLPRIMDEVFSRISFGVGRKNDEPVDHPVIDRIREAEFEPQRKLRELAAKQLGTVGAGNHYVDLFAGDDGFVWVGVHFGSRGFGHKTASGFLALAAGRRFDDHAPGGEMDAPPVLFHVGSELGRSYIAAMELAGEYAYAGRDVVVERVLEILGARSTYEVHNHHNFAWRERHAGTDVWVIRKGCTPAFPGQEGFVGATMGEPSVILRGTGTPEGERLLHSTVHGAGRVLSRTQAAGKMGTRAECPEGGCAFWQTWKEARRGDGRCPIHGARLVKRRGRIREGLIDFTAVRRRLTTEGIELRGGAADEAPDAYKRLDAVLDAHADTIEIVHRLHPIGVAMAGADTFDPYKD